MSEEIRKTDHPSTTSTKSWMSPPKLNLKRLERIQILLQYVSGFVLLIFTVLITISYFQLRRIRQEIAQQQQTIEENQKLINSQNKQIAAEKIIISGLQHATLSATEANPEQGEAAKQAIENIIGAAQTGEIKQLPPRIYIQIAREDQRNRAADVARQLQARGYIVPGIENVQGKAPSTTQLRFCPTDSFEEDLAGITKTLESISVPVSRQRLPRCGNVRPRHYEIWFGEQY